MSAVEDPFARRFARQVRFAALGAEGQARLQRASALLVGCGALGGSIAQALVRSGIGRLVLVDRDVVEESNLPRQVLFEERHARESALKAEAAAESLARIGGPTRVEAHAAHVDASNLAELARGVGLVLDGTDNLETRYVLNDHCVEAGMPWIYGGVVGSGGLVLPVLPGSGPCLRCVFPEAPPPGVLPTCETAGVLQPAVAFVAALQAGLALRILSGAPLPTPRLVELDAWDGRAREIELARDPACACCGARDFSFLRAARLQRATRLCGRSTVQVRPARARPDLELVARALDGVASDVRRSGPILRFVIAPERFTLFADGRALVEGTEDEQRALALYDRYVGA
ncbi:MAG: ThiF family adenylyltransferase [Planctomycetes bacterium]|nr:ThiF family adenylyltransferase [Planctomycetota bacterium]